MQAACLGALCAGQAAIAVCEARCNLASHGVAGMGQAKQQLKRIFQLVAWMHAELGEPQPQECVGSIVVPLQQLGRAQHLLRGSRSEERVEVPRGHGSIIVTFIASSI